MAINTQRLFTPVQLGTSLSTLFTAAGKTILDKFTLTETTGATISGIDIHIIPSGGTASATNRVLSQKAVNANETYLCPELVGHTLEAGEFLQAKAGTATAVSVRGSGRVVT
jgi:hypothetical protein